MSTRAVVEDVLGRIGTGDPDLVAQAYVEEVDWRLDWPEDEHGADVPWIRERGTRADVADHYRSIAEHHDPALAGVEIDRILVDGDDCTSPCRTGSSPGTMSTRTASPSRGHGPPDRGVS